MTDDAQLSAALDAAARGWAVFPFASDGRTPAFAGYLERATTDPDMIRRAWGPGGAYRGRNIGISTAVSPIVALDLDDPTAHGSHLPADWRLPGVTDGRDVLAVLADRAGQPWPTTRVHESPSGGWHLIYQAPPDTTLGPSVGRVGPCIDVKAGRSSITAPGSTRADGVYRVLVDIDPAPLPTWIADLARPPRPRCAPAHVPPLQPGQGRKRLQGVLTWLLESVPGERNPRLYWAACRVAELIAADELDDATAGQILDQAAAQIGLTPSEARSTIRSGLRGQNRTAA